MARDSNQWMLFGIDMRSIGRIWLGAWREFLFSFQSPLRSRLDEPVLLLHDHGESCYQGGREVPVPTGDSRPALVALQLPADMALTRRLSVPLAAEPELAAVLAMEVTTSSPFPSEDTVHGWAETGRDDRAIEVALVIASRARAAAWMRDAAAEAPGALPLGAPELWADVEGDKVCVRGFGEDARNNAYRRRLLRVGASMLLVLLALPLGAALFAMQQRFAVEDLKSIESSLRAEAEQVAALRERLAEANQAIEAFRQTEAMHPNPHGEIVRLTRLLGDEAFLTQLSMAGDELQLRGLAKDAAVVMQTLADSERYAAVTAPQAIATMRNSDLEQFYLDIDLAAAVEPEGGGEDE